MGKEWRGKPGARFPNGRRKISQAERIEQAAENRIGSVGAQRRRARCGHNPLDPANDETIDAIGRVFAAGLLPDERSKGLLDAARRLKSLYSPLIRSPHSSLAYIGRIRGSRCGGAETVAPDHLAEAFEALASKVRAVRPRPQVWNAVYDLVLADYPDEGPRWADRLIEAAQGGEDDGWITLHPVLPPGRADDRAMLALAISGLEPLIDA